MRLLIALVAASLPLSTSVAAPQREKQSPPPKAERQSGWAQTPDRCDRAKVRYADETGPVKPRKLTELPPGNLQLAVLREVDGCPEPVIVRYNFTGEN